MGATFSLERFERADASAGTARLCLVGHWSTPPDAPGELLVGDRVFAPLPDRGQGERWRAVYLVPVGLLDASAATIALRVGVAGTIPLPAPVVAVVAVVAVVEGNRDGARIEQLDAALSLAREAWDEIEALVAILHADLQDAEAEREAGAARLAEAASHAEALTRELSTTRDGRDEAQALLEILKAELAERAGQEAAREAELAERGGQEATGEAETPEDALVMARDRAAGLEARVATLEGKVLELELARATAQERADELATRLGPGG